MHIDDSALAGVSDCRTLEAGGCSEQVEVGVDVRKGFTAMLKYMRYRFVVFITVKVNPRARKCSR